MPDFVPTPPIVVDNFSGRLTRVPNGSLNSGLARYTTSFGYQPYNQPGTLNYYEVPQQIDSLQTTVTQLILKFKDRVESGVAYCYGYDYSGRFYKITLSTDTPVFIGLVNTATMHYGGGMSFYKGSSEKVWLGHDGGATKMGFDGTSATEVTGVTWVQNVPRPTKEFLGNLYVANDTNIVEIGSGETVLSAAKLSPTIPSNYHIVDMDVTTDGRYLAMLCNRNTPMDVESANPTDVSANQDSAIYYWNGADTGITTYENFPSFTMTALSNISPSTYRFGYDAHGAVVRNEQNKFLSMTGAKSPLPWAVDFSGNQAYWGTVENVASSMRGSIFSYGAFDQEVPPGLYRNLQFTASGTNGDVAVVGALKVVSGLLYSTASSTPLSTGKIYYSTYETGGVATAKLFKWSLTPTGSGVSLQGVYETQTQIFSEKKLIKSVRVYVEPTVAGNSLQVDLIGSDGNVLTNGSKTYTYAGGTDVTQAQGSTDLLEFGGMQVGPTYALGVRLTNKGTVNLNVNKVELDVLPGGR